MDVIKKIADAAIKGVSKGIQEFVENLQETKTKQTQGGSSKNQPHLALPRKNLSVPVALCLIVPASAVENLKVKENNLIDVSDIKELIDRSLYFLCTSIDDVNATQKHLRLTEEDTTTVSQQREIYIGIEIANGKEMIAKKIPYILKKNLPLNGKGDVRKVACLEYLSVSGLEKFNRV